MVSDKLFAYAVSDKLFAYLVFWGVSFRNRSGGRRRPDKLFAYAVSDKLFAYLVLNRVADFLKVEWR